MGCGQSSLSAEELEKRNNSAMVDKEMQKQAKAEDEKIKLLLLGAGESGKSTIFKQMKVIYGDQYTEAERRQHLPAIHSNILHAMKALVDQAGVMELTDQVKAVEEFELIRSTDETDTVSEIIGTAVETLWKDPGIQAVWERRNEFQIIESVQYYFNKIDKIKQPGYLPDKDDILFSRVRTSGIVTERYTIDGTVFEMYDVGGQRNERKKWIHCFEGVTAVIFVAAISEYDQKLFEDSSTNRMVEALELFSDICNNVFFMESSMILFLNKKDLFEVKIKTKSIRDSPAFSDFNGRDGSAEDGIKYFLEKFMSKNKSGNQRQIYHHVTCATDTGNVKVVFNACKDIILRQNLSKMTFSVD